MYSALKIMYPLLCVAAPCIIYQLWAVKKGGRGGFSHWLLAGLLMVYLTMAMSAAGFGTLGDIGSYDHILNLNSVNLKPFDSYGSRSYFLNIVMFLPLGILLPLLSSGFRRMLPTVTASFLFSLTIELSQMLNIRCTDVDDLIANTFGGFLGFLIWKILSLIFGRSRKPVKMLSPHEAEMYMLLGVMGEFFLYHWRILL